MLKLFQMKREMTIPLGPLKVRFQLNQDDLTPMAITAVFTVTFRRFVSIFLKGSTTHFRRE